ncbi:3-deoxy-manno-octulosonate cytidylyltransferase [Candidatus Nitrotoga arctica]|uniref:3-deoxy-manno-octulosonate cytidylyltransferase n=1 Tax=Candidatus Nitrotoga arctica TaxID=453162 RepID=A0ABM8YW59_9PROT|nr:3-deoxy-manno-octulosonate cytidylyltransferase [Candidatus Nitrotoga arctica]CAG9931660.1 3-deoxy-manno-octulosonate cytidylyltransferase [Candidatus Nitrotoga arctica]
MIAFHVVIPARFASTRLPGKALLPIGGKPMVVRVAEQSAQSGAQQIWIATDHQSIIAAVHEYGFKACLTHAHHTSGTDRIAEVVEQLGWPDDTIVVNVQGDEPLMPPALISAVAQHLHDHPECAIATACHPIHDEEAMRNPNIVKVVLDKQSNALYFSRAQIPYPRDALTSGTSQPENLTVLRHIGIYAYRAGFLRAFRKLAPAAMEQIEALEQLRALWHGYKIGVTVSTDVPPSGVDTEQDLHAARKLFDSKRIINDQINGAPS